MPITDMSLDNGIFYVREEGEITKDDAQNYVTELSHIFKNAEHPVVILIDAINTISVSMEARKIFARITGDPKHERAFVACDSTPVLQAARVIGLMSKQNKTFVYQTLERALFDARKRVNDLRSSCN